jgi:hypothetical protein
MSIKLRNSSPTGGRNRALFALLAIAVTIGWLWAAHRPVTTLETKWEDVQAEAEKAGYRLITTKELKEQYEKNPRDMLLVDTRQEWEYRTGHIKDAFNFSMEPTWWSRWRSKSALEALLGPDKNRFIVFY